MIKPSPNESAARTARQLRMLQRMAEIGVILARQLLEQVKAGTVTEDPSMAFESISRAVRQTIILERKLAAQAAHAVARKRAAAQASQRPGTSSAHAEADDFIKALIREHGVKATEAVLLELEQWPGRRPGRELARLRAKPRGSPKPKTPEPSPAWPFDPHPPGAPPRRPDG